MLRQRKIQAMNFQIIFLVLFIAFINPIESTSRPVVGILAQPSPYDGFPSDRYSYIPGSYVSHIEAAGASVIPIQWDMPNDKFIEILSMINGLYFPGGAVPLVKDKEFTAFQQVGNFLVDQVINMNQDGYFPLMGVCLGYEMISLAISNDPSILVYIPFGANARNNIYPTLEAWNSTMYKNMDPILFYAISHDQLAYFDHSHIPDPFAWIKHPYLAGNFTITSWTNNTAGTYYVASVEGKELPIYGLQFHPEKNTYEWSISEVIPHNANATSLQQHMANVFVNQTRLNTNYMPISELMRLSIYNYHAHHMLINPEFEQLYFIPNYNISHIELIGYES